MLLDGDWLPMTNLLLVKSIQIPLPINLSSLTATLRMSDQQFYDFCRTNPELRIERNADREIAVMPPALADTGNRKGKVFGAAVCLVRSRGY